MMVQVLGLDQTLAPCRSRRGGLAILLVVGMTVVNASEDSCTILLPFGVNSSDILKALVVAVGFYTLIHRSAKPGLAQPTCTYLYSCVRTPRWLLIEYDDYLYNCNFLHRTIDESIPFK